MRITSTGNVGIGTTNPYTILSITPSTLSPKITLWDGGVTTNHYGFGVSGGQLNYHIDVTSSNHVFYAAGKNGDGTELMRIRGTGNVGINTTNPLYRLDVSGTGNFTGLLTANVGFTANASSTIKNTSGAVSTLTLYPNNISSSTNTRIIVANDLNAQSYNYYTQAGDAGLLFNVNGFQGSGSLIIAPHSYSVVSDPSIRISYTNGTVITGSVNIIGNLSVQGTITSTSDYRIKYNPVNLDGTFTVDNLNPLTYTNLLTNKQDIGFLAHEIQEYYPYLVLGEKDDPNYQSLNYNGLIGILTNEIKVLKKQMQMVMSKIDIV